MQKITITDDLAARAPGVKLACILCDFVPEEKNEKLWNKILLKINRLASTTTIEDISRIPAIAASRKAYKACGKDPARYRLSAEALLRRVVNRNGLYQVNNVVDALNLVSISTGYSIGGYDAGKINGDVTFGIGQPNEPYSGIGRGELNIEGMPVFRDGLGAFGTPTSDSGRTMVTPETKKFLMIIIDYAGSPNLPEAVELAKELLENYAQATNFEIKTISKL